MKIALLIIGGVLAAVAGGCFVGACYVLQHAPQPQATQGMFGFCAFAAIAGIGSFACGYRYRHDQWP